RQPSRDPAHDTRRLGDMLDDMKHGCKIDGGRRNVRAVLHPPLVDLIPAVAQLPYVLFRQVETVNAILRNAAAREQVKVPAIAAADVEERARDASLLQKAPELEPIQQLLALAGDEGSFVGTVVGVVGGWIDDGELGCRRSRIEPYRATFAALPEVPFIAAGLQLIIISAGKMCAARRSAHGATGDVFDRYLRSAGIESRRQQNFANTAPAHSMLGCQCCHAVLDKLTR